MARIVAFIPDLLFGSSVVSALGAAGHEPVLASNEDALRGALSDADALIVDLTFDVPQRIELVRSARPGGAQDARVLLACRGRRARPGPRGGL